MRKFISLIAASVILLNSLIAPISVLAQVPPSLTSTDITSDGSKIGDLSGATLVISNLSGTMHTLNINNVVMDHPPNSEEYPFYLQADDSQQTTLTNYFASKSWPEPYLIQIDEEIKGNFPFFYFKVDNGNYSLVDGFKKALGSPNTDLVIDDDYPTGIYTYAGTVGSETKTITLTVSTASVELEAPKLISPLNNSSVKGASLTNSWTAVTGATKYIYESYHDSNLLSLRWRQEIPAPSTSKTATNVADSTFWWRVKAMDGNGNESDWSEVWKVTVDNIAPEAPRLLLPTNGSLVTGNPMQSWTSVSGVNHYYYASYKDEMTTDLIYSTDVNGTNRTVSGNQTITIYWKVKAVDAAGNESPWSDTWKLVIDNTAPSTPVITGFLNPNLPCGTITNVKNITVDWTDSVDANGIKGYDYTINYPLPLGSGRGTWNTFFASSQYRGTLNEGIHNIKVRAKDSVGNVSAWSNTCNITYDSIAPDVEITFPTDSIIKNTVPIRGTVSDANLHHYWLVIQDSDGQTITGPGTVNTNTSLYDKLFFNWDTTKVPDGNYTIKLEARDAANNKDSGSIDWNSVTVDNNAPTGSCVTPIDGATVSGSVPLQFNAIDSISGVSTMEYFYSSDSAIFSPISSPWDTTELALDDYILRAKVTDNAGNSADYDITVGVAAVISNQKSTTPTQTTAIITWTTDRPTTSRVVYDIVPHGAGSAPNYGYAYSTATDTNHVTSHSVTIDGLSAGTTYYFRTISEGSPTAVGGESYFQTLTYAGPPTSSWTGGGMVLGASTNLLTIPNKLALAHEDLNTDSESEEVLGASTGNSENLNNANPMVQTDSTKEVNSKTINWKIIVGIGIIVFVAGYSFYKLNKKK